MQRWSTQPTSSAGSASYTEPRRARRGCAARHHALAAAAAALVAGCAADQGPPTPPDLGPPTLVVVNQGTEEEKPLEQLMLHSQLEHYRGAKNRLATPIGPGQRVRITDIQGSYLYLTVVRKKLATSLSGLVALTTPEPLDLRTGLVEVWVFNESFRIHDPRPSVDGGVPPPDHGLPDLLLEDAGAADGAGDATADAPASDGFGDGDLAADGDAAADG